MICQNSYEDILDVSDFSLNTIFISQEIIQGTMLY